MSSSRASYEDGGLLTPTVAGGAVEEATGDGAVLAALLDAEAALARAQAALGLVPAEAARAIGALRAEDVDARRLALRARESGNPVVPLVAELAAALPERFAGHLHRGATSQDVLDTALMLVSRRARAIMLEDLRRTADALAELAARHRDTPMPGRTLTQQAAPTSFGLKAAGWRLLVLRGAERLAAVPLPAQLGGAVGTLDGWGEAGAALVGRFAAELGLAEPVLPWHVLRTPVAELGGALALVGGGLGKLAADVLVLSRTEIGELAEGSGGGSSAMPHKANPVRATLLAAAARQLPALAAVLYGAMPAEDERPAGAWHAEWQPLRQALRLAGGAARDAAELAGGLRVHAERMRGNLELTRGLICSPALVDAYEPALGRREARRRVAAGARAAAEQGRPLAEVVAEDEALRGVLTAGQLRDALDPVLRLGRAGELVDRALREEWT